MKKTVLNGAEAPTVSTLMENPEMAMPIQTLNQNNILPAKMSAPEATPVQDSAPKQQDKAKKARIGKRYNETGNALNLDNFQTMVAYVEGYGAIYNPSNSVLKLTNLQSIATNGNSAIENVTSNLNTFKVNTDLRQSLFESLSPLATRIMGELRASGASQKTIEKAEFYNRKLQGKRAKKINPDDGQNNISASQMSFPQRIHNFVGLIGVCSDEPLYEPNEDALKITNLIALSNSLQAANKNVKDTNVGISNARIERNKTFYEPATGLFDVAMAVKQYVKAIFGYKSPEYKLISKLSFRNLNNK